MFNDANPPTPAQALQPSSAKPSAERTLAATAPPAMAATRLPSKLSAQNAPDPQAKVKEMRSALRGEGVFLILLGFAHFVLSGLLEPTWGVVLIGLGLLNFAFPARGMFILNGLALLAVGVLNILGGWGAGFLQLIWGLEEMGRYGKYPPEAVSRSAGHTPDIPRRYDLL